MPKYAIINNQKRTAHRRKNRLYVFSVVLLTLFLLVYLFVRGILYIPLLPRDLSAFSLNREESNAYYIRTIGKVDNNLVSYIKDFLATDSKRPVIMLDPINSPYFGIYHSDMSPTDYILSTLANDAKSQENSLCIFGINSMDIYGETTHNVMRSGKYDNKYLMITFHKMRPKTQSGTYVETLIGADMKLYQTRIRKIIRHELGHTFGLEHCVNPSCVMAYARTLKDLDSNSEFYCPICQVKIAQMRNK